MGFVNLRNIRHLIHFGYEFERTYGKDVFYEFLKNEWVYWSKILTNFSKQFVKIAKKNGDSSDFRKTRKIRDITPVFFGGQGTINVPS